MENPNYITLDTTKMNDEELQLLCVILDLMKSKRNLDYEIGICAAQG
jgi:hypothetical protein